MNKHRRATLSALQDRLHSLDARLSELCASLTELGDELGDITDEEREAFENLPDALQDADREYPADELEAAFELITDIVSALDTGALETAFEHIENARGQA